MANTNHSSGTYQEPPQNVEGALYGLPEYEDFKQAEKRIEEAINASVDEGNNRVRRHRRHVTGGDVDNYQSTTQGPKEIIDPGTIRYSGERSFLGQMSFRRFPFFYHSRAVRNETIHRLSQAGDVLSENFNETNNPDSPNSDRPLSKVYAALLDETLDDSISAIRSTGIHCEECSLWVLKTLSENMLGGTLAAEREQLEGIRTENNRDWDRMGFWNKLVHVPSQLGETFREWRIENHIDKAETKIKLQAEAVLERKQEKVDQVKEHIRTVNASQSEKGDENRKRILNAFIEAVLEDPAGFLRNAGFNAPNPNGGPNIGAGGNFLEEYFGTRNRIDIVDALIELGYLDSHLVSNHNTPLVTRERRDNIENILSRKRQLTERLNQEKEAGGNGSFSAVKEVAEKIRVEAKPFKGKLSKAFIRQVKIGFKEDSDELFQDGGVLHYTKGQTPEEYMLVIIRWIAGNVNQVDTGEVKTDGVLNTRGTGVAERLGMFRKDVRSMILGWINHAAGETESRAEKSVEGGGIHAKRIYRRRLLNALDAAHRVREASADFESDYWDPDKDISSFLSAARELGSQYSKYCASEDHKESFAKVLNGTAKVKFTEDELTELSEGWAMVSEVYDKVHPDFIKEWIEQRDSKDGKVKKHLEAQPQTITWIDHSGRKYENISEFEALQKERNHLMRELKRMRDKKELKDFYKDQIEKVRTDKATAVKRANDHFETIKKNLEEQIKFIREALDKDDVLDRPEKRKEKIADQIIHQTKLAEDIRRDVENRHKSTIENATAERNAINTQLAKKRSNLQALENGFNHDSQPEVTCELVDYPGYNTASDELARIESEYQTQSSGDNPVYEGERKDFPGLKDAEDEVERLKKEWEIKRVPKYTGDKDEYAQGGVTYKQTRLEIAQLEATLPEKEAAVSEATRIRDEEKERLLKPVNDQIEVLNQAHTAIEKDNYLDLLEKQGKFFTDLLEKHFSTFDSTELEAKYVALEEKYSLYLTQAETGKGDFVLDSHKDELVEQLKKQIDTRDEELKTLRESQRKLRPDVHIPIFDDIVDDPHDHTTPESKNLAKLRKQNEEWLEDNKSDTKDDVAERMTSVDYRCADEIDFAFGKSGAIPKMRKDFKKYHEKNYKEKFEGIIHGRKPGQRMPNIRYQRATHDEELNILKKPDFEAHPVVFDLWVLQTNNGDVLMKGKRLTEAGQEPEDVIVLITNKKMKEHPVRGVGQMAIFKTDEIGGTSAAGIDHYRSRAATQSDFGLFLNFTDHILNDQGQPEGQLETVELPSEVLRQAHVKECIGADRDWVKFVDPTEESGAIYTYRTPTALDPAGDYMVAEHNGQLYIVDRNTGRTHRVQDITPEGGEIVQTSLPENFDEIPVHIWHKNGNSYIGNGHMNLVHVIQGNTIQPGNYKILNNTPGDSVVFMSPERKYSAKAEMNTGSSRVINPASINTLPERPNCEILNADSNSNIIHILHESGGFYSMEIDPYQNLENAVYVEIEGQGYFYDVNGSILSRTLNSNSVETLDSVDALDTRQTFSAKVAGSGRGFLINESNQDIYEVDTSIPLKDGRRYQTEKFDDDTFVLTRADLPTTLNTPGLNTAPSTPELPPPLPGVRTTRPTTPEGVINPPQARALSPIRHTAAEVLHRATLFVQFDSTSRKLKPDATNKEFHVCEPKGMSNRRRVISKDFRQAFITQPENPDHFAVGPCTLNTSIDNSNPGSPEWKSQLKSGEDGVNRPFERVQMGEKIEIQSGTSAVLIPSPSSVVEEIQRPVVSVFKRIFGGTATERTSTETTARRYHILKINDLEIPINLATIPAGESEPHPGRRHDCVLNLDGDIPKIVITRGTDTLEYDIELAA